VGRLFRGDGEPMDLVIIEEETISSQGAYGGFVEAELEQIPTAEAGLVKQRPQRRTLNFGGCLLDVRQLRKGFAELLSVAQARIEVPDERGALPESRFVRRDTGPNLDEAFE
jgi:hypothetical protein